MLLSQKNKQKFCEVIKIAKVRDQIKHVSSSFFFDYSVYTCASHLKKNRKNYFQVLHNAA
jgi:hypothetical protein